MKRKLILFMSVLCIANLTACGQKQENLEPIVAESYDAPTPITEVETSTEEADELSQYCFLETDFKENDVVYEDEYIKLTYKTSEKEHYISQPGEYEFDNTNTNLIFSYELKEDTTLSPYILSFTINDIGGTAFGRASTAAYDQTLIFSISDREARLFKSLAGETPIQKMSLIYSICDSSLSDYSLRYCPITFSSSKALEHYSYDLGTPIIDNEFCTIYDLNYKYTSFAELSDAKQLLVSSAQNVYFDLMVYNKVPFTKDIFDERKDTLLNDTFHVEDNDFLIDLETLYICDDNDNVADNCEFESRALATEAYNIVTFSFDYNKLVQQQTHKISLSPYCRSYPLSAYDDRVTFDFTDVVNKALENPIPRVVFAD